MYCAVAVVSVAFVALLGPLGVTRVEASTCEPPVKGFHWEQCSKYLSKSKTKIFKVVATQGGVLVDKRGGLDLTLPLTLAFNISFTYGKPIKSHRYDQKMSKYIGDDNGKNCHWEEIDTQGLTDDIDGCKFIKSPDCAYKNNPTYVVTVIDFPELFGDAASGMEVGSYYAFESIERDGNTFINCIWMQAKIIKVE
jgi:hypothetical protein